MNKDKDKDILPEDSEGRWHGYCERYNPIGMPDWKGVCVHGLWYGYIECSNNSGDVSDKLTGYYLGLGVLDRISRHNTEGYCYIWNRIEV